jgi:hypothetical protein
LEINSFVNCDLIREISNSDCCDESISLSKNLSSSFSMIISLSSKSLDMDTSDSPANEVEPRKDPSGICATHDNNDPPEFEVGVSVFSKSSFEVMIALGLLTVLFLIVFVVNLSTLLYNANIVSIVFNPRRLSFLSPLFPFL